MSGKDAKRKRINRCDTFIDNVIWRGEQKTEETLRFALIKSILVISGFIYYNAIYRNVRHVYKSGAANLSDFINLWRESPTWPTSDNNFIKGGKINYSNRTERITFDHGIRTKMWKELLKLCLSVKRHRLD